MGSLSLNPFDAAIYLVALVAVVMGFNVRPAAQPGDDLRLSGRGAARGGGDAASVAVCHRACSHCRRPQPWVEFAVVFLATGLVLSALCGRRSAS